MANVYKGSDAANSAIRALLKKIGEIYLTEEPELKQMFNKNKRKNFWEKIKKEFGHCCAYCGLKVGDKKSVKNKKTGTLEEVVIKLEREHLLMTNKDECGLDHPGNIVPSCGPCNVNNRKLGWKEHLFEQCAGDFNLYHLRLEKIESHIKKYKYPEIPEEIQREIRKKCDVLYNYVTKSVSESEQYISDIVVNSLKAQKFEL
ncbi:hypothetical protein [Bacillus sp. OK048]|uniref:hypothetical protein n=1 Tax=Bacillus sp. OK048 TaxID=1882761 RepID=UPI0008823E08|nr:hypothetical protein [Bacillus sp. OK048]SDN62502.1 hypothetical protein SAMN05443253_11532 [Bacillus sp. OK048]